MKLLLEWCGCFYTIQFDSQRDRLRLYWLKHLKPRVEPEIDFWVISRNQLKDLICAKI